MRLYILEDALGEQVLTVRALKQHNMYKDISACKPCSPKHLKSDTYSCFLRMFMPDVHNPTSNPFHNKGEKIFRYSVNYSGWHKSVDRNESTFIAYIEQADRAVSENVQDTGTFGCNLGLDGLHERRGIERCNYTYGDTATNDED